MTEKIQINAITASVVIVSFGRTSNKPQVALKKQE